MRGLNFSVCLEGGKKNHPAMNMWKTLEEKCQMESHNFQFVTHTQIWGPDDNFTEEGDHERAGMRRSNPLLKLNVCSCERDGAGEQSQPAVGRSHNVTWVIRHSAVNRAGSANARRGFYKSRCLLFFHCKGKAGVFVQRSFIVRQLESLHIKGKEASRFLYKKRSHIPISGLIFQLELQWSDVPHLIFKKRGAGGGS